MKKSIFLVFSIAVFSTISCRNSVDKGNSIDYTDNPFQPFKVIYIKHPVEDFKRWKTYFDAQDSIRKIYGIRPFQIGRGLEDSNMVTILARIEDIQKAKEYSSLPSLKADMHRAGVTDDPLVCYLDVFRNEDSNINISDRLIVMYKIKNFGDWLKFFNKEGAKTRSTYGIIDRGLARDIDNPNTLYFVFAVSDVAKAKTHFTSESFDTFIHQAGAVGEATLNFYTL